VSIFFRSGMSVPNLHPAPIPGLPNHGNNADGERQRPDMFYNAQPTGHSPLVLYQPIMQSKLDVYNLTNYTFSMKDPEPDRDITVAARMQRLKAKWGTQGMRRSVDAVLVVHQHSHPHILLIQMGNNYFRLPGGRCREGEDEVSCLKRKLQSKLSPPNQYTQPNWEIGEVLGTFWRPNFEPHLYPYLPPHITKPKECVKMFVIPLPEKCIFAVPRNYKLLAVPLFELYDNVKRYGPVVAAIPPLLSRLGINYMGS
jgi:cleavage and polyadenylation specificity factor subunit 5